MKHLGTRTLETERLLLRRFESADAGAMYKNWASNPEVTKYLSWPTHSDITVSQAIIDSWVVQYDKDDYYNWTIVEKGIGEPIGGISIVKQSDSTKMVQVGYCIGEKWWHKGYTSEALAELVRFFFEDVGVNRIEAWHDTRNQNSGKVMAKCRLKYEGTHRQSNTNNQGGFCDSAYYAILAEDYFADKKTTQKD